MKWFQHNTDSYNDPDISDAEDVFGDAGYSVFFKILEIYGREFNSINSEGKLKLSQTFLRRKLRKSWTKVEQILNFYQIKNRIFYEINNNSVSIYIPKFLRLSDNWTKKTINPKDKKLQSNSVQTTAIEIEEKKKKKNNIYIYRPIFEFWNSKKIVVHRKIDDKTKTVIRTCLKTFEEQEIIKAIENYYTVLKSDKHFFTYKWPLIDFLNRGLKNFIDAADPIENYLKDKKDKPVINYDKMQ